MKTKHLLRSALALALAALLAACANPALRQAEELSRANQMPQAYAVLGEALKQSPQDHALRAAQLRLQNQLVSRLLIQVEGLRATGRWEEMGEAMQQLRELDPKHPRLAWFEAELKRGPRQELKLQAARAALREGKLERAEALGREILV